MRSIPRSSVTSRGMGRPEGGLVAVARRWWPVPVVIAGSIVVQKLLFESRYDVSGHAAGHLSSATPAVIVACLAWLAATVLVLVGNVRVVEALVDAGLGHAPTTGLPDVADHGLANLAPWLAVVAAVAMAGVFWQRNHVSRNVAIGSGLLSVVFPPWIIPGAGVLVLVVARCIAYEKSSRSAVPQATSPTS